MYIAPHDTYQKLDKSKHKSYNVTIMNQQTPTQKLLSPSMMNRLSASEETRVPIPREDLQSALGEIGTAAAHDLPNVGEKATLKFSDGSETPMTVTGYNKSTAEVEIPTADGASVQSNVELGAFEQLTQETRNQQ